MLLYLYCICGTGRSVRRAQGWDEERGDSSELHDDAVKEVQ